MACRKDAQSFVKPISTYPADRMVMLMRQVQKWPTLKEVAVVGG